ncbi:MAG: hypothetical protein H6739_36025 [Alphaproteobacteria bacterium]|nr:hypothetical protein [Alphaproteobacteria bacterium]
MKLVPAIPLSLVRSARAEFDPPRFDGEDCGDGPEREVTLSAPRRRTQGERLRRLHVRAVLYGSPDTCCSAVEFADAMGMREGDARALQPLGLRRLGRSLRAPFGAWLDALFGADPSDDADPIALPAPRPASRRRRSGPRKLKPLGGRRR